jgi:hypothetical protein
MSVHKEIDFEVEICEHLANHDWLYGEGDARSYDRERALFPEDVIARVQATQRRAWNTLTRNHGDQAGEVLLERLRNAINKGGALAVLRRGFGVHAGNQIARDDRDGQKALAEYILRNAFSEQKITTIEDTGTVIYRSGMTHGSNKKNFEVFSAEEFIAAITQHIPDKSFQMVRYYGWYSSRR